MSAKIIDGRALASKIRESLKSKAEKFEKENGRKVGLAVVIAGQDEASHIYVRTKIKTAGELGIEARKFELGSDVVEGELIKLINNLNSDNSVDGILVQLPLPRQIDSRRVLSLIDPRKDVDGFHALNSGKLFLGEPCLAPCTPKGVIELLKSIGETFEGREAVVIGRSNIVGKPMAMMLLNEGCTVTVAHSKTRDLALHTRRADILVVAAGKKDLVRGNMVKPGSTIIDVGINRHDGKLYGDVNFEEVSKSVAHITPVPGGVGPMTIAMVLQNVLEASQNIALAKKMSII